MEMHNSICRETPWKPLDRTAAVFLRHLSMRYPVVTLTGPRQSGKTTLCRMVFPDLPYATLEDPEIRQFAQTDPKGFLAGYPHGGVLDEFQRVPDLPSYIQAMVDEPSFKGVFILTGSRNLSVREAVSQSLAGRTALVTLLPFSYEEAGRLLGGKDINAIMQTGFLPRIHDRGLNPSQALADYVGTYVERDVRQISQIRDLSQFQKFLGLCAGRIGQLLNLESLGNDAGIAQSTAREWISLLEAGYITFRLPPFFANISKRLIKSPKLYFYDVGLAAYLMGITDARQVATHPLRGMLFENMIVVEILKYFLHRGPRPGLMFYRDSNRNEVDLLVPKGDDFIPVEIKAAATISDDFFKGIKRFAEATDHSDSPMLVYGGTEDRLQHGTHIVHLDTLSAALAKQFPRILKV